MLNDIIIKSWHFKDEAAIVYLMIPKPMKYTFFTIYTLLNFVMKIKKMRTWEKNERIQIYMVWHNVPMSTHTVFLIHLEDLFT